MATFFSGKSIGVWSGQTMVGSLSGTVSRSGNTVTISGLTTSWTATGGYGSDSSAWHAVYKDGNQLCRGTGLSMSGGSGSKNLGTASFSVNPTDTSANLQFRTSDGSSYYQTFTVNFPSGYVAPTVPTVSASATAYNSVSITYGTTSFGVPSSGTVYLYGGTSASPTTQIATKTTTGSSTYTWSSRAANTKYYIRSRAGNGSGYSDYSSDKTIITPCQEPSSISLSSQTYTAYNKVSATISVTRASDGNAATRTLYYRYKTGSGGSWSSWVSAGTMDNSTTTKTATITGLATSSTIYIEAKLNNGLDSASKSFNFSSKTTHIAPNFSNFTYEDTNTYAVHVTGNNQVMLQGQSDPKITISTADKATGNDGIAVYNYSFSFSGRSDTATWSSSSAVTKTLGRPTTSGTQTMTVSAIDALSLSKAVNKSVTVYPWSAPTVTATATRINNFENDTTIHIVGTWSPVTISGVNKNMMEVKYRYKQSTTTTWGSWITLTASHDTANWTTQDFVLNLDNNYSWDLEAYVGDYFTSKTASITIPAGQPQFFIGADGRCAVGGKPTAGKTKATNKGQVEVSGAILGTFGNYDNRNTNENPKYYMDLGRGINNEFKIGPIISSPVISGNNSSHYTNLVTISPWGDDSGGRPTQISIADGNIATRYGISDTGWSDWKTFARGIFTLVANVTSTAGETSNNVTLPAQGLYMVVWYQGGLWPTQVILHCATGWQSTSVKIMGSETKISCKNAYSSQSLPNPILSLTNTTNAGATWHIYRII